MGRLYLRFAPRDSRFGGVDRVNREIVHVLRRRFEVVADPRHADLQVCSHDWGAPTTPRRLFVDHGAFADAGFWAHTAPRLMRDDTILVASRVCQLVADRLFGDERPVLRRVPFFADTSLFRPAGDRSLLRKRLSGEGLLPADGPLLLAVAGYSRRKNLHLAVQTLAEVHREVGDARLALVGLPSPSQIEYAGMVEKLIHDLGLEHRVHRIASLSHASLSELMAASDALVHLTTCRIENFGLVVAESLAAGLPVIGADWGGLRDLVEHGASGYLAPTWLSRGGPRVDWRGAAAAIVRLLADPPLRESMGRHAATFARDTLALESFETRLCDTVRDILQEDPGPPGPARLSARGEDLMFATIRLHRGRPDLRSTSAEYRALLGLDPELCRFLTGPAASSERAPTAHGALRAYPVVSFHAENGALRVTDPAWEQVLTVTDDQRALACSADGRTLAYTAARLGSDPAVVVEAAQVLLDEGVLGPLTDYL